MHLEILRLVAILALAIACFVGCLRTAWNRDQHPVLRLVAGIGAGGLGLALTGAVVASAATAILVLLHPGDDLPVTGPFPLGREHLVGQSSFDDVGRCPLEFPQLRRIERCLGEDRSFQEKSWWVAAAGSAKEPAPRGDTPTCRRFGLDGYDGCTFHEISNELERTRSRLTARRRGPGKLPQLLVIEVAGTSPHDAARRALAALASSPGE